MAKVSKERHDQLSAFELRHIVLDEPGFDYARAVYGTESHEDDKRLYRSIQAHECLENATTVYKSVREASADMLRAHASLIEERDRLKAENSAWRKRFPQYTYLAQDECIALAADFPSNEKD